MKMIREIEQSNGKFYLEYREGSEQEILLNYLIKEYNLEDVYYKSKWNSSFSCNFIERKITTKRKQPTGKITECIRAIESYQGYTERGFQELTRDEKITSMQSIIQTIKIVMSSNIEVSNVESDYDFLKKQLGI